MNNEIIKAIEKNIVELEKSVVIQKRLREEMIANDENINDINEAINKLQGIIEQNRSKITNLKNN